MTSLFASVFLLVGMESYTLFFHIIYIWEKSRVFKDSLHVEELSWDLFGFWALGWSVMSKLTSSLGLYGVAGGWGGGTHYCGQCSCLDACLMISTRCEKWTEVTGSEWCTSTNTMTLSKMSNHILPSIITATFSIPFLLILITSLYLPLLTQPASPCSCPCDAPCFL